MTTQDYPIGIQTFRTIREEGKLYVAKTAYIHQLVSKGYRISTEYNTSRGRIDIVLRTKNFIYIMELKLNKSAQEAIDQINSKEYAMPFRREGCKLFKIGMNFSSQSRTIDSWIIETD